MRATSSFHGGEGGNDGIAGVAANDDAIGVGMAMGAVEHGGGAVGRGAIVAGGGHDGHLQRWGRAQQGGRQ